MKNCFIDFFSISFCDISICEIFVWIGEIYSNWDVEKCYIKLTLIKIENWRKENKFNFFISQLKIIIETMETLEEGKILYFAPSIISIMSLSIYLKIPSVSMVKMIQRNLRNKKYNWWYYIQTKPNTHKNKGLRKTKVFVHFSCMWKFFTG